jgi:uncharacterized protein (DUF2147 family)
MKKMLIIPLLLLTVVLHAQTVAGKWKTIDDESGEEKSIVEIYEKAGKFFGKVVKIFPKPGGEVDPICDECSADDPRFKKKIIGMEILTGLEKAGDVYTDGEILDPQNGKVYRCKIWVEGSDLKVRGYWGPFFRTQTWKKVN